MLSMKVYYLLLALVGISDAAFAMFNSQSRKVGLKTNIDKTKIMSNVHVAPYPIAFGNSLLEVVDEYVYLGQLVRLVDNLNKCKINDGDCERNVIQSVIRDIAKTGVPELKIPPIDPIAITNVSMSIVDLIDLTLDDGIVKGVKDCVVDKFSTNVETERAFMELTCDVTLKAHYKVFSKSPLIKTFLGGDMVNGDGNLKVKIEKIHIRFDYLFYIQRRAGEIYIKCKKTKTIYEYDILGNLQVYLDNLYLGKQDASATVSSLINQNWKLLTRAFGKPFMDIAMEFVYEFVHAFFDNVPVKYYISEDLSKYARE